MAQAVGLLAVAGVTLAGASAVLFAGAVSQLVHDAQRASAMRVRLGGAEPPLPATHLAVAGIVEGPLPRVAMPSTASLPVRSRVGRDLSRLIVESGISTRPALVLSRFLLADVLVLVATFATLHSPWPAVVLSGGVLVLGYFWLQATAENRFERMRAQLPDAFTLVGNSLASGLSLVQALAYAAAETPAPLGSHLVRIVNDVEAGISLSEALDRFRVSVPLRELQVISAAIEIQHRVGGNMREMLEQATQSVRQSLELRMSLRAQTAQGRLSAKVVGLMPLGLVAVLSLVMDGYLESFFGTPAGVLLFCLAMAAEFAGFVIIRRVLDVEI